MTKKFRRYKNIETYGSFVLLTYLSNYKSENGTQNPPQMPPKAMASLQLGSVTDSLNTAASTESDVIQRNWMLLAPSL